MVFQSYALFSHLSVADNIVLGLRIRKASKQELSERFSRMLTLLGLEKLRDRKPSQLLGEQQQRVALARALVAESKIWLMNEPLLSVLGKQRASLATFSTRPYSSRRFCVRSSCSVRSLPTRSRSGAGSAHNHAGYSAGRTLQDDAQTRVDRYAVRYWANLFRIRFCHLFAETNDQRHSKRIGTRNHGRREHHPDFVACVRAAGKACMFGVRATFGELSLEQFSVASGGHELG